MKYIKGFDSLRAFSIIFVILTHLGIYEILPDNAFLKQQIFPLIAGTTGVRIFFTLSGFLITKILLDELLEFGNINFRFFFIRRFLRLLPPLFVLISLMIILNRFGILYTPTLGFMFSIFYIYNFIPNKLYTINLGHTWSLALEEQYYLIWPFIINFINKKKIIVLICLMVIACFVTMYIYPHFTFRKEYKMERWFFPAVAPIIIGSLFAILIHDRGNKFCSFFQLKNTALIIGIILFLFPLYTPKITIFAIIQYAGILNAIGVSFILSWILFNQDSKFTNLLNNRYLSYIGKISYGLYVYQGLFLGTGPSGKLWIQQFPQNIFLTFATAIISFHLLEKPILNLKNKYQRK